MRLFLTVASATLLMSALIFWLAQPHQVDSGSAQDVVRQPTTINPAASDKAKSTVAQSTPESTPESSALAKPLNHAVSDSSSTTTTANHPLDLVAIRQQIRAATKFPTNAIEPLLSAQENFIADSLSLLAEKSAESGEAEIAVAELFARWQQQNQAFSKLQLELAQCDIDLCVVSFSGVEQLNGAQQSQFESQLLTRDPQSIGKLAVQGSGGVYGIFPTVIGQSVRMSFPINPRFTNKGIGN